MGVFPLAEREAWVAVNRPFTPPRYMHWVLVNKIRRQRANWLKRVQREPDGCWSWTGPQVARPGRAPILAYYVRSHERHPQTSGLSAYWWMIQEWFPAMDNELHRTYQTCGNERCVSPVHRRHGTPRQFTKLTDEQVLSIYRQRYDRSTTSLAAEFGVTRTLVRRIWIGESRSKVTGHGRSVV